MFFSDLENYGQQIVLTDARVSESGDLILVKTTYQELVSAIAEFTGVLDSVITNCKSPVRPLVLLKMHNCSRSVVDYLALLSANVVCIIVDPDIQDSRFAALIAQYRPAATVELGQVERLTEPNTSIFEQVAVLLPTSGSTGAPKHVALSYQNLNSNAASIAQYLPIEPTDRALSTLPLYYSYGLSVVNSHLSKGANLIFSPYSVMNREFWSVLKTAGITSFAGVPNTYEMLHRLRFTRQELPDLRYFTQAGGRLAPELVTTFAEFAKQNDKQFFIMYGQTEATARMAYLEPHKLLAKPSSIGQAIPAGEFKLKEGELLYRGPNVMLGYSKSHADLHQFDSIEWLATGDLADVDSQGDYCIVGRKSRFIKIKGIRMDLDAIERALSDKGYRSLCTGNDQQLVIAVEASAQGQEIDLIAELKQWGQCEFKVNPAMLEVLILDELPLTANSKPDYPALQKAAGIAPV